jgi:tetratricopeptide (TPR) repeat protein
MAQETQAQSFDIDQTLNKTDFGHFVSHHKKSILIGFAVALVLVIIVSFVKHQKDQAQTETLNKVYAISQDVFTPFSKGEIKLETYKDKFSKIDNSLFTENAFIPYFLGAVGKLVQDGETSLAIEQLEMVLNKLGAKNDLAYFINLRLAPLYENSEMNDKALKTYESLATGSEKLLEPQIYLNLARLYLKTGKKDKAVQNFNFVIKNHADTEYAKIANLYLVQINK